MVRHPQFILPNPIPTISSSTRHADTSALKRREVTHTRAHIQRIWCWKLTNECAPCLALFLGRRHGTSKDIVRGYIPQSSSFFFLFLVLSMLVLWPSFYYSNCIYHSSLASVFRKHYCFRTRLKDLVVAPPRSSLGCRNENPSRVAILDHDSNDSDRKLVSIPLAERRKEERIRGRRSRCALLQHTLPRVLSVVGSTKVSVQSFSTNDSRRGRAHKVHRHTHKTCRAGKFPRDDWRPW